MSELVLIVADCPAPPLVSGVAVDWPRLQALESLLSRSAAVPIAQADWRGWLQARLGLAPIAAPAGIVAAALPASAALPGTASLQYWLATPVHFSAGLDTVRLHPQGLLQLQQHEAEALAADFGRVFAGSGWELHATGGRELLLAGPTQRDCTADDPACWCGLSPKAGMVRGVGARALRLLGAEMEMWLYEHPVNRARANAAKPTVSALWLWGGSQTPTVMPQPRAGLLLSNDLFACSLWRLLAADQAALPPAWRGDLAQAPCTAIVPWSGAHPGIAAQSLETRWLAPLLADWRHANIAQLCLIVGSTCYRLEPAARWKFWRRVRPWWEMMLT